MGTSKVRRAIPLICGASLLLGMGSDAAQATVPVAQSRRQTVYATAYSYVLRGDERHTVPIAPTLVIRNTDPASAIVVTTVDYRDSKGERLRRYAEEPIVVGPLASIEFAVQASEETGGHSPSSIVQWEANKTVNAPVVETLMIGGRATQGISFVGRAWAIEEAGAPATKDTDGR